MKIWTATALVIVVAIISVATIHVLNTQSYEEIEYVFSIAETIGIDTATDIMRFGVLSHGSTASRNITITHPSAKQLRIQIRGEGSEYLFVSENPVTLINQTATIQFKASIPENATEGTYSGTIRFIPLQ